jgi:DNA modification methylase
MDWDERTHRRANLAANNPRIGGQFTDLALEQMQAFADEDPGLSALLQFDALAQDWEALAEVGFVSSTEPSPVDDGEPEPPPALEATEKLRAKWGVEPGQVWTIRGKGGLVHRVLCGDCRRAEDVARLLDGRPVNVAFTSPPYAAQREYDQASEFRPVPPDQYVEWFDPVQENVRAHLADDASWFVNIKPHCEDGQRVLYVADLVIAHVRRWGWRFVDELCWVRAGVPGAWPNRFKNSFEPVFHFSREVSLKFRPDAVSHETEHAFAYSPSNGTSVSGSGLLGKDHARGFHDGTARPGNVIAVGTGGTTVSGLHPAEFPVALPEFFVRAYSDAGDAVYDPFLGGGATLLAAERLGRAGLGMEMSPRYVAVVLERLAAAGLTPTLEATR